MAQGISEVLVYAVGVAITLSAVIAVILLLFSERAGVNGPVFVLGWVLGLAVVSGLAYVLGDQANASTSTSASDAIAWGKIVFGVARVGRLRVGLSELANDRDHPRGADPSGVGGAEQLVVLGGRDEHQLVLRAVAVATLLAAHRPAGDAGLDGHAVRKGDGS